MEQWLFQEYFLLVGTTQNIITQDNISFSTNQYDRKNNALAGTVIFGNLP